MKIDKLDRLKQIKDLREVWPKEAKDFTPWLAEEENLAMLGDAIGVEMELTRLKFSNYSSGLISFGRRVKNQQNLALAEPST